MNKEQALQAFWAGFTYNNASIPAYDNSSVPDTAIFPRLTYEGQSDNFDRPVASTVSIWTRGTSWAQAEAIKHDIESAISRGGVMVSYDGGALWIKRGTPFSLRLGETDDDMIRRIVINLELEFID